MKCWNCGSELDGSTAFCAQCGAAANRREPATREGRALHTLLEHYGRDRVLTSGTYLVNGLADLMEDAEPLRTHLKLAMDAGLGQLVLEQLKDNGAAPSAEFTERATRLLIEKAGLSDKIAAGLLGYVDDMLGWQSETAEKKAEILSDAVVAQTSASKSAAAVQQLAAARQTGDAQQQTKSRRGLGILAMAGIVVLLIMHASLERTTWEYALGNLFPNSINNFLLQQQALKGMLMMLCGIVPPALALSVPFLLGKGKKTEALVCAAVYTVFMASMVGGLAGRNVLLGVFELPMLLFALLLVYCTMRGRAENWLEPELWALTVLCVIVFAALSFANIESIGSSGFGWTSRAWVVKGWFQKIFLGGATYYTSMSSLKDPLTAFFPLNRVLLVAMVSLLFRFCCKKQN